MGFSKEWNDTYASNAHLSIWPWSDVVSLVHRHCKRTLAAGGAVLEVGCGSGYCTALLSRLAGGVYSMDRYRTLLTRASETLAGLGVTNVTMALGDGRLGWPQEAPFDRIIVMGAIEDDPGPLLAQLAAPGLAVAPVIRGGDQKLIRFERAGDGALSETVLARTRFLPLQPGLAREL